MIRAPYKNILTMALIFFVIVGSLFLIYRWSNTFSTVKVTELNKKSSLILQLKKTDHIRGSKNPKILLIEYSDFECPFCKKFQPTLKQILQAYGTQVTIVFRHFPLPIHQYAMIEAQASECATELGGEEKFWQFHDLIFERTKSYGLGFSPQKLAPLASEIGISSSKFQDCLDSGRQSKRVEEDIATGERLGISGTPTTILVSSNGKRQTAVGSLSYDTMKQMIDTLLK